ncbi:Bestrophin/UPF0187 [Chytridium lagenaria]|nr:Bestrophin/UPF0187 [Chytridium lagenaria]
MSMFRNLNNLPKHCRFEEEEKFIFSLQGSVLHSTYPQIFTFGAYGSLMYLLYQYLGYPTWFVTPTHLISVTTGVVGTTVGFQQWSALTTNLRNMSRLIWLYVEESTPCARAQKVAALKLLSGLSFAIKHELRASRTSKILSAYIKPLMRTKSTEGVPGSPVSVTETQPLLLPSQNPYMTNRHHSDFRCGCVSLPLMIMNQLSVFNASKQKQDHISPAMSASLHSQINAVIENITGMDRILSTRIPHAYGLHLRQVLVLYCFFLPFQIMAGLGWYTGPCLMLVSFVLFGIENLGLEIENPFGYDPNDLPLDRYCETIKREVDDLIRTRRPITLEDEHFDFKTFLKDVQDDIAEEKFVLDSTDMESSVSTVETQ